MTIRTGNYPVAAALLFFALTGSTHAFKLWDDVREKLDHLQRSSSAAVKMLPKAAAIPTQDMLRALGDFSDEEELAIGKRAAGNLLGVAPVVDDPSLQKYVNRVGRWNDRHRCGNLLPCAGQERRIGSGQPGDAADGAGRV